MKTIYENYFSEPERRLANHPRRRKADRRYRIRSEALLSDCRISTSRRMEDEDGFIEISDLYVEDTTQAFSPRH